MIFSDAEFWRFFAVVFLLYAILPHRGQNWLLLGASYVFYGAWDWRFLGLLMFSTTADYGIGRALEASRDPVLRQRIVILSVMMNLTFLGFFKYFNFFTQSFIDLAQGLGFQPDPFTLSIALPVGISFYTFQSMSYTIDVYRGDLKPCRNFFDFALFVAFFPQLVAGPIVRATHLLPRVLAPRVLSWEDMGRGAVLCLTGLIKKIVIADGLAPLVDTVYGGGSADPTGAQVAFATWAFALQIYCDFSGYTDIARGVAKILGFELPVNFAQPYFATNPQEFWRRWHISLSTWLRDYLYISLGGNRGGRVKTYRNLFLTMLLGGIWHGAAWNYVLWGAYQGGLLCLHRVLGGGCRAGRPRGFGRSCAASSWWSCSSRSSLMDGSCSAPIPSARSPISPPGWAACAWPISQAWTCRPCPSWWGSPVSSCGTWPSRSRAARAFTRAGRFCCGPRFMPPASISWSSGPIPCPPPSSISSSDRRPPCPPRSRRSC